MAALFYFVVLGFAVISYCSETDDRYFQKLLALEQKYHDLERKYDDLRSELESGRQLPPQGPQNHVTCSQALDQIYPRLDRLELWATQGVYMYLYILPFPILLHNYLQC